MQFNLNKYKKMTILFELILKEHRKLNAFIKTCEAMMNHSDTALFKVKKRGVYILLTDFESFCCLETRLTDNVQSILKTYRCDFSAKILLDSMINILRRISKNKRCAMLYADSEDDKILKIREMNLQSSRAVEEYVVDSVEHRARVYYVISTNQFKSKSEDYIQFRIPNIELNKIITMQCILSGNSGGVGQIDVTPVVENPGSVKIHFFIQNQMGAKGGVTIHTKKNLDENLSVPVFHLPVKCISTRYLLTYLKRSQNILTVPSDSVTVYISNRGILIQTDVKEHHYVVVFISDITNENLESLGM